jgi:hypothetical protein
MTSDPLYWRLLNSTAVDSPIDREHHAKTIWLTVRRAMTTIRGPRRR